MSKALANPLSNKKINLQSKNVCATICGFLFILGCNIVQAEQKQTFGTYEVHYIAIPTTFLKPDIANQYNIVRAKNRTLVNISVLQSKDGNLTPVAADITGHATNLLSQQIPLEFRKVQEGSAIYYLALLRHSDEEHFRFKLNTIFPDGTIGVVEFKQKVYF